jgi:hypothetical protein
MHVSSMRSDRETMRLRWSALGLAVALAVVAACGPELGRSDVETEFGTTLTLTADHPVVTRSLDYIAEPGAQPVLGIDGYIEVVGVGDTPFHPDVWVSILNLRTGDSVDRSDGIGSASVQGWGHSAPCDGKPLLDAGEQRDLPVPPCQARWTVIARWLEAAPGVEIPLELNARMRAYATELYPETQPFTLDALAITDAGVPLPVDGPAVTRAAVRGSTRFTPSSGRETHRFALRVPGALLDRAGGDLRLGRIFAGVDLTERSHLPISMRTQFSIDDDVVASATAPTAMERDWLARCEPGSDCELQITLTFEPTSSSEVATMPPDGVIAFDWVIEARFEDFGEGATVPAELELLGR